MQAWYLVHSKPQRERTALENLVRQRYAAYLPLMRNRKRLRGRYTRVVEPMFPRYLFVSLNDRTDDWGPIRSTLGVSGLVRFGMLPARVPDELIAMLRAREDADGVQRLPPQRLERGDRLRIVEGPFAGYEALYEAGNGAERIVVLLDIAERAARVVLREDDVEPLAPDWRLAARGSAR